MNQINFSELEDRTNKLLEKKIINRINLWKILKNSQLKKRKG